MPYFTLTVTDIKIDETLYLVAVNDFVAAAFQAEDKDQAAGIARSLVEEFTKEGSTLPAERECYVLRQVARMYRNLG
jgi:hypothetical protein